VRRGVMASANAKMTHPNRRRTTFERLMAAAVPPIPVTEREIA
jgi:hypothetical protein